MYAIRSYYAQTTDSIQYQCLAVLKAEIKVLPKNPLKDLKMELQINYADH